MANVSEQDKGKVVSFARAAGRVRDKRVEGASKEKPGVELKTSGQPSEKKVEDESFADIMRRNAENAQRLRTERAKANKGVLKSYRIKKKT